MLGCSSYDEPRHTFRMLIKERWARTPWPGEDPPVYCIPGDDPAAYPHETLRTLAWLALHQTRYHAKHIVPLRGPDAPSYPLEGEIDGEWREWEQRHCCVECGNVNEIFYRTVPAQHPGLLWYDQQLDRFEGRCLECRGPGFGVGRGHLIPSVECNDLVLHLAEWPRGVVDIVYGYCQEEELDDWRPPDRDPWWDQQSHAGEMTSNCSPLGRKLMSIRGVEMVVLNKCDTSDGRGVVFDIRWFAVPWCTCTRLPCECICRRRLVMLVCDVLGLNHFDFYTIRRSYWHASAFHFMIDGSNTLYEWDPDCGYSRREANRGEWPPEVFRPCGTCAGCT